MSRVVPAAFAYFALVFALGFLLGTGRVLLLEPRLGVWGATLLELPVMLAASWWLCRWVMRRWRVRPRLGDRAIVGIGAFALLMAAEVALGTTLFDRDLAGQVHEMTRGAGALGLAAQMLYAAFPVIQLTGAPRRQEPES